MQHIAPLHIAPLSGAELAEALPALARLRIEVFRAFPYLYDGTLDYEANYLSTFAQSRDAVIVVASDGGEIVGCATGSALDTNHAELIAPLAAAGIDLGSTFYCGESVLLPAYRGRGIGHAFFDQREAHARAHGYARACFCAVARPEEHPLKPQGYSPLDAFWRARGYAPLPGAVARFGWTDVGEAGPSDKPMQFWMRDL
jgi:GNAT superfamily N-acetyltransferase